MAFLDWEDGDRYSFDDSERFEEESICSWMSDTAESVCNNWRGWKKEPKGNQNTPSNAATASPGYPVFLRLSSTNSSNDGGPSSNGGVLPLVELSAKEVACNIPFEIVEHYYPPVPDNLQLRIAYWSFPENEEDIRLYSCLANGSAEEFVAGERLLKSRAVRDLLQIGFHLSATVTPGGGNSSHHHDREERRERNTTAGHHHQSSKETANASKLGTFNVAVTFDRRRITSCDCTCPSSSSWCSHVVAVCLYRIHQPITVTLRAPVSESLGRLERDQLQKFAQYLIAELPQQILPTAQRLLDELLSSQRNAINTTAGAPDPTAGASASEVTHWCLDESRLHENIRKILNKLCIPSPMVFADVNCLNSTYPPAAAEWQALLKPLNGRVPEGLWNLLFIVREMFRRGDQNSVSLLGILTEEVLTCDQISLWWFNTKISMNGGHQNSGRGNNNGGTSIHSNTHTTQHACSSLCDEIVVLWRLACLNPRLSVDDKETFFTQLKSWHVETLEKVSRMKSSTSSGGGGNRQQNGGQNVGNNNGGGNGGNAGVIRRADYEAFSGFKPALEACLLSWDDYPIQGVTTTSPSTGCGRRWFSHSKDNGGTSGSQEGSKQGSMITTTTKDLQPSSSPKSTSIPSSSTTTTSQGTKGSLRGRGRAVEVGQQQPSPQPSTSTDLSPSTKESVISDGSTLLPSTSSSSCPSSSPSTLLPNHESTLCENSSSQQQDSKNNCQSQEESATGAVGGLEITPRSSLVSNRSSFSSASEGFCEGESESVCQLVVSSDSSSVQKQGELLQEVLQLESQKGDEEQPKPPTSKGEEQHSVQQPSQQPQPFPNNAPPTGGAKPRQPRGGDHHVPYDPFDIQVKRMEDPLEILFARAEALHAHGLTREACRLAVHLAEEMLSNPPNLSSPSDPQRVGQPGAQPTPPLVPSRGKRGSRRGGGFNPASHHISLLASATLSKAAFLCAVLGENSDNHHLAFRIGLFALEMSRPPASTKALEVKLANQESELANLLRRIPLTFSEMEILREKASALREGRLRCRGEALLPLILSQYIFDALVWSQLSPTTGQGGQSSTQGGSKDDRNGIPRIISVNGRLPSDEELGFEAAVAALGLKANISEAEHPLLCEGTRIQRRDLALILLPHYKDDPEKLEKIMDKLLDKEIHQMYKNRPAAATATVVQTPTASQNPVATQATTSIPVSTSSNTTNEQVKSVTPITPTTPNVPSTSGQASIGVGSTPPTGGETLSSSNSDDSLESRDVPSSGTGGLSCTYPRPSVPDPNGEIENGAVGGEDSTPTGERDGSPPSWDENYKLWEAKFRCTNLKATTKKHSVGMASVDSSAPETTSSDNSPTVVRRSLWLRTTTGPPSESGSSGDSSDSSNSVNGGEEKKKNIPVPGGGSIGPVGDAVSSLGQKLSQVNVSPPIATSNPLLANPPVVGPPSIPTSSQSTPCLPSLPVTPQAALTPGQSSTPGISATGKPIPTSRFKGKVGGRGGPSLPNQPSEASSHAMFELAKQVLQKAGGSPSSGALFQHQQAGAGGRGPHRALHMCAFQIGVYALGLHNAVSPNWLSRTYSSQSKWVTDQAEGIGAPALSFLLETWEGHLTPKEVCYLADTASRNRDPVMVKTAAKLALSTLQYANVLDNSEISRVLVQCQEQSNDLLEQACLAVEQAAKGGGIPPDMLFGVAKKWYELYEEAVNNPPSNGRGRSGSGSHARNGNGNGTNRQASIGEFQVPPANGNNNSSNIGNGNGLGCLLPDFQQPANNPLIPVAPYGGIGMPHHPQVSSPYGFFPSPSFVGHHPPPPPQPGPPMMAFLPQAGLQGHHPGYPGFYPPPSVTATTTALVTAAAAAAAASFGAARAGMLPPPPPPPTTNPLFGQQQHHLLSNVVVTQAAAIAQAQTMTQRFQMMSMAGFQPTPPGVQMAPMFGQVAGVGHGMVHHHHGLLGHPPPAHHHHHQQQGHHPSPQPQQPQPQLTHRQWTCLVSAYRVGMLAMDTLSRRVHDDRPQAKYARNPFYAEDVKWLLGVAKKLGNTYVNEFCMCTVNSVASPFVLYDIVIEAAQYLTQSSAIQAPLRSHLLTPLIQKCQQMFIACAHFKIYHINPADYDEFVSIIRSARAAFQLTPGGMNQFNELVQSLRRSKSFKKDLWQHLNSSLQQTGSGGPPSTSSQGSSSTSNM